MKRSLLIIALEPPLAFSRWRRPPPDHAKTQEEGDFNQLRAQLGNDVAIKVRQEGKLPFPDGTIMLALGGWGSGTL